MRRTLGLLVAALALLVAGWLVAGCTSSGGGGGSGRIGGLPGGTAPVGVPPAGSATGGTTGLHNDKFPCNLATQADITALAGGSVAYDEIEPDGQTCVYVLAGSPAHVDIAVLTGEDKAQWSQLNQAFPAWTTGADLGGKAVSGIGDDAFLTETPGYAGQLDIWRAAKLLRITVDVPRRLTDADIDKLVSLGRAVAGRI